jgi:hypothetical protein
MEEPGVSEAREPEATLKRSLEYLQLKMQSHADAWGLGSAERWDIDMDQGLIWFTQPEVRVTAKVQVIGTHHASDASWLWAWDHPSVEEPLFRDALLVEAFGRKYGLYRYVTRSIRCTRDEAWQFTALACHLAQASGAYCGLASGDTAIYVTFHDAAIERLG